VKQRAEEIRSNPSFEQQEEYPQSDWRFVAWWNTSFGIASFPDADIVRQEIRRSHPRNFDFLNYHFPSTVGRVNPPSVRNNNPAPTLAERISLPIAQRTLAERIALPTAQQTLAQRITFPGDERNHNLASRVTYPAGHPSSLESRITFPKKKQDQHRIQKKSHKDAAPRRN
jgi:hypothetical protein